MGNNKKPLLTIGIIFKNESRCLERCLKALAPLRKAISCELIMADTGSSDGSREIASQYADILFDFPWIDDFSAARNAVMERSSGRWYLTVDADEYLDKDISELADFLRSPESSREFVCGIVQRNYDNMEMDGKYSDFLAMRMVCMSTGLRYQGAIHEAWPYEEKGIRNMRALSHTILHHDGYVGLESEQGKAKRERNLTLLRKLLMQEPENLKYLLQYIESDTKKGRYWDVLRHAVAIVETKSSGWQLFGPPIFRYAVKTALEEESDEFWEWVSQAETLFPESVFIRIDVGYMAFTQALKDGNLTAAVYRGERCLKSIHKLQKDKEALTKTVYSTLLLYSPYWEQGLRIYLADIYIKKGTPEKAGKLLQNIDGTLLDIQQTGNLLCVLGDLHRLSRLDTAPMIEKFREDIKKPIPSEETAHKREEMFYQTAALAFHSQNRKEEQLEPNFCRPSYMMFIPLLNQCDIGRGAAVLALTNPEEMQLVLEKVEDWERFPAEALSHALKQGVSFPFSGIALQKEEMEHLAARISASTENYVPWLINMLKNNYDNIKQQNSLPSLTWIQSLCQNAIRSFNWKTEKTDIGLELARLFAQIEKEYLSRFYSSELLSSENMALLPAFHRFGWFCMKAFDALDFEDIPSYIRELKAGLTVCPEGNIVVEYLTEHTPQLKSRHQEVSEELLELAAQVKKLLSGYPPNHPSVIAIKASEAYQKVAELIENECQYNI